MKKPLKLQLTAAVIQYPDPRLRQAAERFPVEQEGWPTELLADMRKMAAGALGLAATQVGVPYRVMLVRAAASHDFIELVNPLIVRTSRETETRPERCLSFDEGKYVCRVARARKCVVQHHGGTLNCAGALARIVQHELDHLDGITLAQRDVNASREVV